MAHSPPPCLRSQENKDQPPPQSRALLPGLGAPRQKGSLRKLTAPLAYKRPSCDRHQPLGGPIQATITPLPGKAVGSQGPDRAHLLGEAFATRTAAPGAEGGRVSMTGPCRQRWGDVALLCCCAGQFV